MNSHTGKSKSGLHFSFFFCQKWKNNLVLLFRNRFVPNQTKNNFLSRFWKKKNYPTFALIASNNYYIKKLICIVSITKEIMLIYIFPLKQKIFIFVLTFFFSDLVVGAHFLLLWFLLKYFVQITIIMSKGPNMFA